LSLPPPSGTHSQLLYARKICPQRKEARPRLYARNPFNLNFLTRLCGLMVRRWRLIGYFPILYNPLREEGLRVAEQGYLAPLEHGADSSCRSLYALALMFPPKLGSHKHTHRWRRRARARAATRSAGGPTTTASWVTGSSSWGRSRRRPSWSCSKRPTSCRWAATKKFFANRDLQGFGGRALTGPFRDARRLSLYTMVPRTGGYAFDVGVGVWGLFIVQGPFSVVPCHTHS
jgi:hypothetical protein